MVIMFAEILKQARLTDYDFRHTAYPKDPLDYRFDDWVEYYKLKWAMAHVLKPASILEIGVRFGYSAAAFLNGCPSARYIGIDLDSDSFGGTKGAIKWARKITSGFKADYIVADTQSLSRLPGGIYDLVHVDGQQDGDGSFHDLSLAVKQARYILVDGYFWTRANFMAVNEFLFQNADLLEFYGVIPGYAGELLIKVSDNYLSQAEEEGRVVTSNDLRQAYTSQYYLRDCGGFDSYKKTKGKRLADARLKALAMIASLKNRGRVLELGCGRGELTYHFAKQGFEVTAVDYSQSAIGLAKKCFEGEDSYERNVSFIQDNVCTAPLEGHYDLATASDLIEHLLPSELDLMYERVAKHLKPDGVFVIHTFPNLWLYQYEHPRRKRIAASVGAYLPDQPRTRYELLMHINEQSPRTLKKQLSKNFKHVLVWLADVYAGPTFNPGGSLLQKFGRQQMRAAPDIFAVASHSRIDLTRLKSFLQMQPLTSIKPGELSLLVKDCPGFIAAGSIFESTVELTNNSQQTINSQLPSPVHISYHWLSEEANKLIVHEGERSDIFPPLTPLDKRSYAATINAPTEAGIYTLRLTLMQEHVRWFDNDPLCVREDVKILVSPAEAER